MLSDLPDLIQSTPERLGNHCHIVYTGRMRMVTDFNGSSENQLSSTVYFVLDQGIWWDDKKIKKAYLNINQRESSHKV